MNQELHEYLFTPFSKIPDQSSNQEKKNTAVVIVTDKKYFKRAEQTIIDVRTRGNWKSDIVLITIDFDLNHNIRDYYNLINIRFPIIDKSELLEKIKTRFLDSDSREFTKVNQWEKFHVFDDYFKQWSRIVYFDAGLRVLEPLDYLLELDYKGAILAPNDAGNYNNTEKMFKHQLSHRDPDLVNQVLTDFGNIMDSQYFLNCIWVYDTEILNICNKTQLIDAMNKYPLCKTNEMTVMNLLFHFKHRLWKEFPMTASNKKILFDWCELNCPYKSTWRDYCYIKYPVTIPLHFE
jgi:lipopolysaccharide biosynthesis glycosyltransferase